MRVYELYRSNTLNEPSIISASVQPAVHNCSILTMFVFYNLT